MSLSATFSLISRFVWSRTSLLATCWLLTAVLSVSAEEVHRNAKSTETAMLFESSHWLHGPRPTASRFGLEGCFVSREWTENFDKVVSRAESRKDHVVLHKRPQRTRPNQRVQYKSVDGCRLSSSVDCGIQRQHGPLHDGTTDEKQNERRHRVLADPCSIDESWNANAVEAGNTLNLTSASLCTFGEFRRARNSLDHAGAGGWTGSVRVFARQRRVDGRLGRLVCWVHAHHDIVSSSTRTLATSNST